MREFADEPDKNKWLALQSRATENREEIRQLIQELEEIQSRFLLDETSTFRQLLIDLHSKQSRYDQILGLKSEQAISESEAVIAIAEAYQMLIESIQNHEKVIREYIRDMEQESQGQ